MAASVSWLAFPSSAAAQTLTEQEAVRIYCERGPDTALVAALREQGRAQVDAASVYPNPILEAEYGQLFGDKEERELGIGLSVPLGIGGARYAQEDAAEDRLRAAVAGADATMFEGALAYRQWFIDVLEAKARRELMEEHQSEIDEFTELLRARSEAQESSKYDLATHALHADLHRNRLAAAKRIERLQGQRVKLVIDAAGEIGGDLRSAAPLPDVATRSANAEVEALRHEALAYADEAEAASRRWIPDVMLGGGYAQVEEGGNVGHGFMVHIALPLTFFDHGQGQASIARAESASRLARAERKERELAIEESLARENVQGITVERQAAVQALELADSLVDDTVALYQAGEVPVHSIMDARDAYETASMALLALDADAARARLSVMHAAGSFFAANLDAACRKEAQ